MVSIVIPVYNKSPYLTRCFKSLDGQSYKDLEVILIDDGSTDDSLAICKSYKARTNYKCVVISQTNSGPSKARNVGLGIACGEFVLFLDADDYLHEKCIEISINVLINYNVDFVEFNCSYNEKKAVNKVNVLQINGKKTILKELLQNKKVKTVVWGSVYTRRAIDGLKFNTDIKWGEDSCFKLDICLRSFTMAYINTPLYINCLEQNTLSRMKCNEQVLDDVSVMINYFENKLENLLANNDLGKFVFNRAFSYLSLLVLQGLVNECEIGYEKMKNYCDKYFEYTDLKHKIAYELTKNKTIFKYFRRVYDKLK